MNNAEYIIHITTTDAIYSLCIDIVELRSIRRMLKNGVSGPTYIFSGWINTDKGAMKEIIISKYKFIGVQISTFREDY